MKIPRWLQRLFAPTVHEVIIDGEFYTTEGARKVYGVSGISGYDTLRTESMYRLTGGACLLRETVGAHESFKLLVPTQAKKLIEERLPAREAITLCKELFPTDPCVICGPVCKQPSVHYR